VSFTSATQAEAQALVDEVVAAGWAACGQIGGPIRSTYRWQGKVERSEEWRTVLTTTSARSVQVVARIRARHSYDTPEIMVTPVVGGDPDYLGWVVEESSVAHPPM